MTKLKLTPEQVTTILRAEIAGLLHNIGKLDPNFLASTVPEGDEMANAIAVLKSASLHRPGYQSERFGCPSADFLALGQAEIGNAHIKPDEVTLERLLSGMALDEYTRRKYVNYVNAATRFNAFIRGNGPVLATQEAAFRGLPPLQIAGETWSLPDLLTLFWDDFFKKKKDESSVYEPGSDDDPDYSRESALKPWLRPDVGTDVPRLLILSHGEVSGQEKKGYTAEEKLAKIKDLSKTAYGSLRLSSAFGYEPGKGLAWQDWASRRTDLLGRVPAVWDDPAGERAAFVKDVRKALAEALGDTQRPINEISLWDYASAIAALFKAGVAGAILGGGIPTPKDMRWRLLTLRLDGSEFLAQANQVADLKARDATLRRAYDAVRYALEVTIPLGNAVYRDEDGLLLIVPHLSSFSDEEYRAEIEARVRRALSDQDAEDARTSDYVAVSDATPTVTLGEPLRGKKLLPGDRLRQALPAQVEPGQMAAWWRDTGEVCSVCGLRPQGYMPQGYIESGLPGYVNAAKARERRVCGICLARRGRRSKEWAKERRGETIWLDEVGDIRGQVALVVGRFDLDAWLDGTLIRSLAIGVTKDGSARLAKPPTFARVQRVWRTTQAFWEAAQKDIARSLTDDRRRLVIHPRNELGLGAYHVYDLDLGPTRMSVVWRPEDGGSLLSADNFGRVARLLGEKEGVYTSPAAAAIAVEDWLKKPPKDGWRLFNPDATNIPVGSVEIERVEIEEAAYATVIPILADPRSFMALVPADRALDVAEAIRKKYECEFGKVRNRLPLHLGLVFADARQPLRALLDAGRRMLAYPGRPAGEKWRVEDATTVGDDCVVRLAQADGEGGQRALTWRVPLVMGDGTTKDDWYPYVFVATGGDDDKVKDRKRVFQAPRPTDKGTPELTWLVHVGDLVKGDEVYFTPATLDVQWLDAAARRFEIAYDGHGRRLDGRAAGRTALRPYLLDDLATFEALAAVLGRGLSASQRHALRDAIEGKRDDWRPQGTELQPGGAFWQFCRDAMATVDWRGEPPADLNTWADHAARGTLTDIIELYERLDLFPGREAASTPNEAKEANHA